MRAIEDRDVVQLFPFVTQLENALRDERGLLEHIVDADDRRLWSVPTHRAQLFLKLKSVVRDGVIRELQYLRRGAVVCLQLVDHGI